MMIKATDTATDLTLESSPFQDILKLITYISLWGTWGMITLILLVVTEGWLAPWDTKRFRPPVGSWDYTMNNFFESGIGSILPALLIVLISVACYSYGIRKVSRKGRLTLQFALINFVFLLFIMFLVPFLGQIELNTNVTENEIGYQHTLPLILLSGIGIVIMLVIQFICAWYNKLYYRI